MRPNMGTTDRDLRIVLAAVFGLIALFAPFGGPWQIIPAILAVVMLATAATAVCPLYLPFRINTRKGEDQQSAKTR
jgi:hypothetical protein